MGRYICEFSLLFRLPCAQYLPLIALWPGSAALYTSLVRMRVFRQQPDYVTRKPSAIGQIHYLGLGLYLFFYVQINYVKSN